MASGPGRALVPLPEIIPMGFRVTNGAMHPRLKLSEVVVPKGHDRLDDPAI